MSHYVYIDGDFVPQDQARISVFDRGFLFGDGIYEVTAVLGGHLVDFAAHIRRLDRSCGEIGICNPMDDKGWLWLLRELVQKNGVEEGVVYIQITRGAGTERDFVPSGGHKPTVVAFTQAKDIIRSPHYQNGVNIITVPDLRWKRRDIKSVNLLPSVLAKLQASSTGAAEAWLVSEDGTITEGASSTAFIVQGNALVTRPNSSVILPGCTRSALMAISRDVGFVLELRAFTDEEVLVADEAFFTGASNFVVPVISLDGQTIGGGTPGTVTRQLQELYLKFARESCI